MKSSRRSLIAGLGSSLGLCLARPAQAMQRPLYGGSGRLTLPVSLRGLSPYDPQSLSAALFGRSLFESLYAETATGRIYPALAADLPSRDARGCRVELRPELVSHEGRPIDARFVVTCLTRAKRGCRELEVLGSIEPEGSRGLRFSSSDVDAVAQLLASPRAALSAVGLGGPASEPACGPYAVHSRSGRLELIRNARAPRGGGHVLQWELKSGDLRRGLRDFELHRSLIGMLGPGLYESRGESFSSGRLGWVWMASGRGLGRFGAPGVLQKMLRRIPQRGLRALGVAVEAPFSPTPWSGPAMTLLVDDDDPWLSSIATEIATAWSQPGSEIRVQGAARKELDTRRRSGRFDAMLGFLRDDGMPGSAVSDLFDLVGAPPPRGGRSKSLTLHARHLTIGIVGELSARGAVSSTMRQLPSAHGLDLAAAYLMP